MQIGEEGDTRQYHPAHKTDYSPGVKAALEHKPEKPLHCEVCKQVIIGKAYQGSRDGLYLCQRCWDE